MKNFKIIHPFNETLYVYEDGTIYRPSRYTYNRINNFYSKQKGYYPKQSITTSGYLQIQITDSNHTPHRIHVHDLVAYCYCDNIHNFKEVHHIDGNKLNNHASNLQWCSHQFNQQEMIKFYNKQAKKYFCKNCHKPVSPNAKLCIKCNNLAKQNVHHIHSNLDDSQIYPLLIKYNGNFTKVAKLFNISDVGLRKRCKRLNIPFHSSDYKLCED